MKEQLSILLPTYNCRCVELVQELHRQCEEEHAHLDYEIIVADDGSSQQSFVQENKVIETLPHVRYLIRKDNTGRAAVRNFLVTQARYEWLLFIDGDLTLHAPHFIKDYQQAPGEVVVGGLQIADNDNRWHDNLRYRYEKRCEQSHDAAHRQRQASKEFRTTNFLIARHIMQECPFDEHFRHYGYEDVLLGKSISDKGYPINHINNPILLDDFEDNYHYLLKVEESCRTLYTFHHELKGYSTLIDWTRRIRLLSPLIRWIYPLLSLHIKSRLTGNKPSIFLFNMYKLIYYTHLNEPTP